VRSRVRPVSAAGMAGGPNALRGSGPNQNRALWKRCVDPSGLSRSPERPYLHYVAMPSPIGVLAAGLPHALAPDFRIILVIRLVRFFKLTRYSPAIRSLVDALMSALGHFRTHAQQQKGSIRSPHRRGRAEQAARSDREPWRS
jgi:hypothetical protein